MELRIFEHDQVGRDIATYVSPKGSDRIEFIVGLVHSLPFNGQGHQADHQLDEYFKRTKEQSSPWTRLLNVFLPAGYPHSVTSDYMWYVWRRLACFQAVHSQASCHKKVTV